MDHQTETTAAATPMEVRPWLAGGPLLGMVCILAATFCFSSANALIRGLSGSLPPVEVAFFRSLFGFLLHLPLLYWFGLGSLQTKRFPLHAARGVLHVISMLLWFVALAVVPLAEAAALEFAAPILTTIIAIFFLGEAVRMRRIVALAIGIVGVVMVVQPGFAEVSWGQLIILLSVALWAGCQLIIRELGKTDSSFSQGFYTVAIFVPITAIAALPVWVWPTLPDLALTFLLALMSSVGIWLYGEAFRHAEMTAILPLEATKLLWGIILGLMFFSEVPDLLKMLGGCVIFAASSYITIREAQLARRGTPPASTG
jgi:drug/metabolite transporter (DMT)-like permease